MRLKGHMSSNLIKTVLSCVCILAGSSLFGIRRDNYHIDEAEKLTEVEAWQYLQSFRSFSYEKDYVFRFKIKHYPPRQRSFTHYGTIYGSYDPLTESHWQRIQIEKNGYVDVEEESILKEIIICRGPFNRAWTVTGKGSKRSVSEIPSSEWNTPLIPLTSLSVFDLLAPYLYWFDFEYLSPSQVKARPSQTFKVFAPEDFGNPIQSVEMDLDDEFRALLKATFSNGENEPVKGVELISFQKTSGNYIPKTIDYRDYVNKGHKTRIQIIKAAMNLELPEEIFDSSTLTESFPELPEFSYDDFR